MLLHFNVCSMNSCLAQNYLMFNMFVFTPRSFSAVVIVSVASFMTCVQTWNSLPEQVVSEKNVLGFSPNLKRR